MRTEQHIVNEAIAQLSGHTGIKGEWIAREREIDGELTLNINGRRFHAFVEVKRELRQYQLHEIQKYASKYAPFMVVAEHIFPAIKEQLRAEGIGYLDRAGNIYINHDETFLWIDGLKAEKKVKQVANRAFTKAGLKTVFYLLLHRDAINLPHRQLAARTQTALGNIQNIIEGLKDAGFILQLNKEEKMLHNKKALLERWIAGYRETLKPALHIGNYTLWRKGIDWRALEIPPNTTALWGGEPAAEWINNYLEPRELTLYTDNASPLVTAWGAIPKENGELKMYEKFWETEENEDPGFVPPLLVYADLLITDDPRCIEAATVIYHNYLMHDYEDD